MGATENGTATLQCELTKAAPVEWMKGEKKLAQSNKYRIKQEDTITELVIQDLEVQDTGQYTCVCGERKTTAVLTVNGKTRATEPVDISVLLVDWRQTIKEY